MFILVHGLSLGSLLQLFSRFANAIAILPTNFGGRRKQSVALNIAEARGNDAGNARARFATACGSANFSVTLTSFALLHAVAEIDECFFLRLTTRSADRYSSSC